MRTKAIIVLYVCTLNNDNLIAIQTENHIDSSLAIKPYKTFHCDMHTTLLTFYRPVVLWHSHHHLFNIQKYFICFYSFFFAGNCICVCDLYFTQFSCSFLMEAISLWLCCSCHKDRKIVYFYIFVTVKKSHKIVFLSQYTTLPFITKRQSQKINL